MIHQAEIIDKQGEMGKMWAPPSYKLNSVYIYLGFLIYSTIYHNMITWYSFNGDIDRDIDRDVLVINPLVMEY